MGGEAQGGEGAPERLGRFDLRVELGRGGMGAVYEAWDSQLKRKVAVKLLHADAGSDPGEHRDRLLREAQAMARVTHPNVIAVYEVGEWHDRVFLVMELVEAQGEAGTLTHWLAARPRVWREVVARFAHAARGLDAAHARGLVHRDFKPDNVLVDAEGRARVSDFGLVGVLASDDLPERDDDLSKRLTRTGRIVGTPRYMAPEQHRAGAVDARSDQFAFCVSLWFALYGEWPFAGDRYGELADNVLAGRVVAPPRGKNAPASIERALRRGLAADPGERWPSMSALLAAIEAPSRAWRSVVLGGVVLAGAATAVWLLAFPPGGGRTAVKPPATPAAVVAPPAAAVAQITTTGGCAYTPHFIDDKNVLFDLTLDDRVDFYTVPPRGGSPTRRTDTPEIEGYASPGRRPGEVLHSLLDPSGKGAVIALDTATWKGEPLPLPGFAPPAVARGTIYYLRADLKEIRTLREGVDEPYFALPQGFALEMISASPDGRWLSATTGASQAERRLCLIDLDKPPELDCLDARGAHGRGVFSPDGAKLYYASSEGGIHRIDLASRKDEVALPDVRAEGGVALSPDGRSVVYSDCRPSVDLTEVTARPPRVVAQGVILEPESSADGRMVWLGGEGDEIVLRETDGTTRTIVSGSLGPPGSPSFDPDGGRVVFRIRGGEGGIWLANVTPFPPERVTNNPNDLRPRFLDADHLIFNRPVGSEVHVYISDTIPGTERRAHPGSRYVNDVFVSRGTVVLTSLDRQHVYEWNPEKGSEHEIPVAPEIREAGLRLVRAANDDRSVLIQTGVQGGKLWRVPLSGGPAEMLWDAPDGATVGPPVSLPNGVVLAPAEVYRGELFAADLAGGR